MLWWWWSEHWKVRCFAGRFHFHHSNLPLQYLQQDQEEVVADGWKVSSEPRGRSPNAAAWSPRIPTRADCWAPASRCAHSECAALGLCKANKVELYCAPLKSRQDKRTALQLQVSQSRTHFHLSWSLLLVLRLACILWSAEARQNKLVLVVIIGTYWWGHLHSKPWSQNILDSTPFEAFLWGEYTLLPLAPVLYGNRSFWTEVQRHANWVTSKMSLHVNGRQLSLFELCGEIQTCSNLRPTLAGIESSYPTKKKKKFKEDTSHTMRVRK